MKLFKKFTTKKVLRKQIEEMEKQIDYLEHQVRFAQLMKTTTLQRYDIETLKCSKIVTTPKQLKFIEEQIAIDLAQALKPYIEFNSEIDNHFSDEATVKVTGQIKIVKER